MTVLTRGAWRSWGREGDPERKDCSLDVGLDPACGHRGQSSLPGEVLALAGDSPPAPWRQAEADLRSGVQARVWYIYLVVLTPGSERGCLGLNGPCVCYTNLARTAAASSELRNPHLNWAFLKLFLIGNTYVAKNANINSKLHFCLHFFLQKQPVLPSFLFLVPGMASVHVCIYTHH